MKRVAITDATRALADYAREAQQETLIVTRRGKPMAAVVRLHGVDFESLAVSTNPDFMALIAHARARFKETGGISLEEMKRRWGGRESQPEPSRRPGSRRTRLRSAARAPRRARSR